MALRFGASRLPDLLLAIGWIALSGLYVWAAEPPPKTAAPSDAERKKVLAERDRLWKEAQDLYAQQKTSESIATAERTLAIDRRLFGDVHEKVTGSLTWLADLHAELDDFKAARKYGEELLAVQTKLLGAEHWKTRDARRELEYHILLERFTRDQRRLLARAIRLMDRVHEQMEVGDYRQALRAVEEAREIRANILGENHWATGYSVAWLGTVYARLGDEPRALAAYRQAEANKKVSLGEDHPSYATALDNLAKAYAHLGDYAKAEPLSLKGLQIRKAAFGENDLTYALGLHNVAFLNTRMKKYSEAEARFREALVIKKRFSGEKSRTYAETLDGLAQLFMETHEYSRAEGLYQQAVTIQKEVLGENHPNYALSLNNLARVYDDIGDYARAEQSFRRALDIIRRALGDQHARYITSLDNLGVLYLHAEDYEKAALILRQEADILRKVAGESHPDYARCLNQLGVVYGNSRDYGKAEEYYLKSLDVENQARGQKGRGSLNIQRNLAQLYANKDDFSHALPLTRHIVAALKEQGRPDDPVYRKSVEQLVEVLGAAAHAAEDHESFVEARKLRREAFDLRTAVQGKDHWQTTDARLQLVQIDSLEKLTKEQLSVLRHVDAIVQKVRDFNRQKQYAQAVPLAKEAAETCAKLLGETNPTTGSALDWLAHLLIQTAHYDEAEPVVQRELVHYRTIVGERHPDYAYSLKKLGMVYSRQKNFPKAVTAYRNALEVVRDVFGPRHSEFAQGIHNLTVVLEDFSVEQLKHEDFAGARKSCQEALDARSTLLGNKHWKVTNARLNRDYVDQVEKLSRDQRHRLDEANALQEKVLDPSNHSRARDALPLAKHALQIRSEILGEQHYLSVQSSGDLASVLAALGDFKEAKRLRIQNVERSEKIYGERHPSYARDLHNLGGVYNSLGEYAKAETLYRTALALRKDLLGEDDPNYAASVNDLALNCGKRGDSAQQEFLLRQAVALHKRIEGPHHPAYAHSLGNLAVMYDTRGDSGRAESLFREAATIFLHSGGTKDTNYAWILRCLATLYRDRGQFAKAEPLYRQVLEIDEAAFGKTSWTYASALSNLGVLYLDRGEYSRSRPLFEEALQTAKSVFGEHHGEYADALQHLGWLDYRLGAYSRAETSYRQILKIRKESVGENHPRFANGLRDLARLYKAMQDNARAEPLFRQALTITARTLGERHPTYSGLLAEAGGVYISMGDYERAFPMLRRGLEINRQVLGEKHPTYAAQLSDLGLIYHDVGDNAHAEPLLRQALAIQQQGEDDARVATTLTTLGSLYSENADYAKAEPLFRRALEIRKKIDGPAHPKYALLLYHVGWLQCLKGDYSAAEKLLGEALEIYRKALGEHHAECAKTLRQIAQVYARESKFEQAEVAGRQALEINRKTLEQTAAVQSERQQLIAGLDLRRQVDLYLSVSLRSHGDTARAYEQVLACKGVVSNRQSEMRLFGRALEESGNADISKPQEELRRATAKLAALSRTSPDPSEPEKLAHDLEETTGEIERLEGVLSERSAQFREHQNRRRPSAKGVVAALPAGAVLIDLLDYWDFDPKRHADVNDNWQNRSGGERRFIAFVTRSDSPAVKVIELGPSRALVRSIESWRKTYGTVAADGHNPGTEVRRLLWEPLQDCCRGAKLVLISPDGVVAGLPWNALPGKTPGTYLIEDVALAIIPFPAQLPALVARRGSDATKPSLLIVGDVQFDGLPGLPGGALVAQAAPRATRDGTMFHWSELPGTAAEAEAIRKSFLRRFPGAYVRDLRRDDATEAAVRRDAPRSQFLHFATHGYFAPAQLRSALADVSRSNPNQAESIFARKDLAGFHPGLLSGLVLAGANRPVDIDHDDGILTALEVEALDLSRVELAALSACETGLGELAASEGLLGLQRAFQTAGAQSVVAGLWKVPDRATQMLMERFYENLWQKRISKLEALREAQLWLLREGPKRSDPLRGLDVVADVPPPDKNLRLPPYYWAAFVLSGDWR